MTKRCAAFIFSFVSGLSLFVCLWVTPLPAQTTGATIVGRITDPLGNTVPLCDVRAVNIDTNVVYRGSTNDAGIYAIPDLPPGRYRMFVRKEGFKEINKMDVVLHVQDTIEQNFALQLGSVSESITVVGETPKLNTQTTDLGQVVSNDIIENAPLNGRDFTKLTLLVPGAQPNVDGNLSGGVVVDGQRSTSNRYIIDGADDTVGGGSLCLPNRRRRHPHGRLGNQFRARHGGCHRRI